MDNKVYASKLKDALYSRNCWRLVTIGLVGSHLIMLLFVVTRKYSDKTIVVPQSYGENPGHNKGFWVEGNQVSSSYIEFMGNVFAQKALTYHPKNVDSQFDSIVRNAHPSVYSQLKTKYELDATRIKRNDISSVFHLMSNRVQGSSSIVTGRLQTKIGQTKVKDTEVSFMLSFAYEGKLYISSIHPVKINKNKAEIIEEKQSVSIVSDEVL